MLFLEKRKNKELNIHFEMKSLCEISNRLGPDNLKLY